MCCHFEREQKEGEAKDGPEPFILHFDLKIFQGLDHHGVHLAFHQPIDLDGIHPAQNRPVSQMQKHPNELGILLALDYLKSLVDILLLEDEVIVLLDLRFLLEGFGLFWFFEEGAEDMVVVGLFLGGDGEDGRWEFLVVLVQEG